MRDAVPTNSLPPSQLTRQAIVRRRIAPVIGLDDWSDAAKVALVSGVTAPFAVGWLVRCSMLQADASLSPYVARAFLPVLVPFLWIQALGHLVLLALGLGLRRRKAPMPWLVHAEAQLWCGCLAFTLYAVGPFTHSFSVLLLAVPVVGYLLFEPRPVHFGLVTLAVGVTLGVLLPIVGVLPYAPFLEHAPFDEGRLDPSWLVTAGVPTIFSVLVGIAVHVHLVRGLRERQKELEWASSSDALTGLWNRAAFFARLEEEIARSRRHATPMSLLMIDLDHFKRINDTFGHAVGDRVLSDLATRLREALRGGDVAARYGGEELAVLLPHTPLAQAEKVAERLLIVARTIVVGRDALTVSIGVAELDATENVDRLVVRADEALYAAKGAGRDRYLVASATTRASADPAPPSKRSGRSPRAGMV